MKNNLVKHKKHTIMLVCDIVMFLISGIVSKVVVTGYARLENVWYIILPALFFELTMFVCGIYRLNIGFSSMEIARRLIFGCVVDMCTIAVTAGLSIGFTDSVTRYLLLYAFLSFCSGALLRYAYRVFNYESVAVNGKLPAAVVYGAGELGTTMARLCHKGKFDYNIIGFIDDDPAIKNDIIINYPVFGGLDNLKDVLEKYKPSCFIVAITKISRERIQNAIQIAVDSKCDVKIVPNLFESKGGKDVSLREIDFADLLGRNPDVGDRHVLSSQFAGKTVLVTGAGGSIGSEICRQLVDYDIKCLITLDIDETELHDLGMSLNNYEREWSERVVSVVCDIRNHDKLMRVLCKYKPDIVFHAAAYKHVPLMEIYPEEALETNVCGSYNLFDACDNAGVSRVVVISTDKAVKPTNAMGATKRVVEKMASAFDRISHTDFCCVRFGNVLGSRGSMLPMFLEEIKAGKPITVTDKQIIRFFMTIPEAVSLVFRAAGIAEGGSVMVLDMGKPVCIYEFARKLIDMYGDGRSTIRITGLRPGEKLYEELLTKEDKPSKTSVEKVLVANVVFDDRFTKEFMQNLVKIIKNTEYNDAKAVLTDLVPEYTRQD